MGQVTKFRRIRFVGIIVLEDWLISWAAAFFLARHAGCWASSIADVQPNHGGPVLEINIGLSAKIFRVQSVIRWRGRYSLIVID